MESSVDLKLHYHMEEEIKSQVEVLSHDAS